MRVVVVERAALSQVEATERERHRAVAALVRALLLCEGVRAGTEVGGELRSGAHDATALSSASARAAAVCSRKSSAQAFG